MGEPPEAVAAILEDSRIVRLPGGRNNRVYRVDSPDGNRFLLKEYFRHPLDPRDRLGTEWAFLTFAANAGIRSAPRPIASDPGMGRSLFEWVDGRVLGESEVGRAEVEQALAFYRGLNEARDQAGGLASAAEACGCLQDHLERAERRVLRLSRIEASNDVNREARDFVRGPLAAAWERVRDQVSRASVGSGEQRLSPSDFGFHNALMVQGGRLVFLDFEYAGWDDPAKMICDFYWQPSRPAPRETFEAFARAVLADLDDPALARRRVDLVFPVHGIKWCGILLNEFLPVDEERRRFAGGASPPASVKSRQLEKARGLLRRITSGGEA